MTLGFLSLTAKSNPAPSFCTSSTRPPPTVLTPLLLCDYRSLSLTFFFSVALITCLYFKMSNSRNGAKMVNPHGRDTIPHPECTTVNFFREFCGFRRKHHGRHVREQASGVHLLCMTLGYKSLSPLSSESSSVPPEYVNGLEPVKNTHHAPSRTSSPQPRSSDAWIRCWCFKSPRCVEW